MYFSFSPIWLEPVNYTPQALEKIHQLWDGEQGHLF